MLEIPEALVLSEQVNQTLTGKTVAKVVAASSPHKFAWFFDDPHQYDSLLRGRKVDNSAAYGGILEIYLGDAAINLHDGINLRYHAPDAKMPEKHQLLVEFTGGDAITVSVAMYGGISCYKGDVYENKYFLVAKEKPAVLSDSFNFDYFLTLFDDKTVRLSAKAFLATEQRIPGLGNGVLQDILLNAKIHPKKKMNALSDDEIKAMFNSVKDTLNQMVTEGGRDIERDLFGNPGGYVTKLCKNTVALACMNCGGHIKKENYMGGSIYYCMECQQL